MNIYLDNAATTPLLPEVIDEMTKVLKNNYGNPSSIYSLGRESRAIIEKSRKQVAELLGAVPGEIFFTSGGTESTNMILRRCVKDLGIEHIISSPIEHHCVLHTIEDIVHKNYATAHFLPLDDTGNIDIIELEKLLQTLPQSKVLVSLMHANNEIGNQIDLYKIGHLAHQYNALFHSDTVQTLAHYKFDLNNMPVDFITGSSHKFHGPKGTGIAYISSKLKIKPLITGGSQERNMRAGTENVQGIVGFAKAIELAYSTFEQDKNYILSIKEYLKSELIKAFDFIQFNGNQNSESSLYTVLSVAFPKMQSTEMLIYNLDIAGVCVSGGSACSSGANAGSHVINALYKNNANQSTIRFSFSKFNTKEEIDQVIEILKKQLAK